MSDDHPKDPIGIRDHDAQNPNGPRIQNTESKDSANSNKRLKPTKAQSFMLTMLINFTYNISDLRGSSTFVPSARALFLALDKFYARLQTVKGFHTTHAHTSTWPVVRLAMSYLFYFRVLQVSVARGIATPEQFQLLELVTATVPLSSMRIPEPFVPFFQAITAFMPSDTRFGPVVPFLPAKPGATADNHGALSEPLLLLLPNHTAISRMALRVTTIDVANPRDPRVAAYINSIHSTTEQNYVAPSANAPGLNSCKNVSIGTNPQEYDTYASAGMRYSVAQTNADINIVPSFINNVGIQHDQEVNTWTAYLRLHQGTAHLTRVFAALTPCLTPFTGNRSLDELPTIDGAYAANTFVYDASLPNPTPEAYRDGRNPPLPLIGSLKIHEPPVSVTSMPNVGTMSVNDIKISAIAQVNVVLPFNYAPGSDQVGVFRGTRFGPYFDPANLRTYGHSCVVNLNAELDQLLPTHLAPMRLDMLPRPN